MPAPLSSTSVRRMSARARRSPRSDVLVSFSIALALAPSRARADDGAPPNAQAAAVVPARVDRARVDPAENARAGRTADADADGEKAREEDGEGEEVLVRGRQAGGFVSRARIDDSPREITDAASLVEPLPGVHVRRLGADDSFATLSIRGSSSTQVAVYLAGVPLTGGADPTLDLATLPLWPGAQARVHRTFAPAALGRGSLGGTLVIDPPSARSATGTEVWTAAGSFGARRLRIGDVRGDPDGVRIATGVSASRSDDDFEYLDRQATLDQGRDVFTTRENAGHAAVAGLASVALPVRFGTRTGALTITGLAQARRQELPGSHTVQTRYQRLDSSRLVSALELTIPSSDSGSFGIRGWGRREGLSLKDNPISARTTFNPTHTDDAVIAAGGSAGWRGRPSERSSIEVRVDGSAERFAPGTWIGQTAAPPAARRTNGGIAIDASTQLAGALTLAASARGDMWLDTSDDGTSTSEQRPSGNVGVEFPLGPVMLASHAGYVTRPPSFVERYGNRGAFIGDPDLKPESAVTTDAGARVTRRLGPLRLHAELAGFATWADDLITYVYAGATGRAKATNIGHARLLGIESELRASAFGFEARASHTALGTANESECRYEGTRCVRPPLPGRPAHDFVADLAYSRGPVRVRYGVDLVAGILADVTAAVEVPTRVLHGAGIRVAVPNVPGLSVTLDMRNIFDLRVVEYAGALGPVRAPIGDLYDYPLPGRRVLLSVRWTTDAR